MNKDTEKRKLRLVEKYENDDYSRIAGPDYTEHPYEGEEDIRIRPEGNWHHPGVSGKSGDETYINEKELSFQENFAGLGPKDYKRSDERVYEDVCEMLMRDSEVDATQIGVKVKEGKVILSGVVRDKRMKKLSEILIEDLPGVEGVKNELSVFKGLREVRGPDEATRNDLGLR